MMENMTSYIIKDFESKIVKNVWKAGELISNIGDLANEYDTDEETIYIALVTMVTKSYLEVDTKNDIRVCDMMDNNDIEQKEYDVQRHYTSDSQLIQRYLHNCTELISEHAEMNNNKILLEDNKAIQGVINELLKYNLTLDNMGTKIYAETEGAESIYDKGLKCAGWSPEKYTLYQCKLVGTEEEIVSGKFLMFDFAGKDTSFDSRTKEYVDQRVYQNDVLKYISIMNKQYMMELLESGEHNTTFDYREIINDTTRWVKVSAEVSRENDEVTLFVLFLDIDEEKKSEIMKKEMTDEDALTGMLNRKAFMLQSEQLLSQDDEVTHAFMMIDIDNFKSVNDVFGHPVGDSVLCDSADIIRGVLRQGDLIGRLGGDEFMVCLKNIPTRSIAEKRAEQIRQLMYKKFDNGIVISGSIGITIFPQDGKCFEDLYKKADVALYEAKENGKNQIVFFDKEMAKNDILSDDTEDNDLTENDTLIITNREAKKAAEIEKDIGHLKKKILIIDDNQETRDAYTDMLKEEYKVLTAKDGMNGIMSMRRYGSSLSTVLLALDMHGMNGFKVLSEIQNIQALKAIPIIVISREDDNEFKAIEKGAVDFVNRAADKRIINLRVRNAVNKHENDRLRAQNSYLQIQSEEEARYRHIVKSTGTIVIEYDWINSVFKYDQAISENIIGTFDARSLWAILLSDMVASSIDVKELQKKVFNLANNRHETTANHKIRLKVISGDKHWFKVNILKISDDFSLTNKMIITLNDINEEIQGEEKLRYLAEYDLLTKLHNRTAFLEKADKIIKYEKDLDKKWVLSVMDVDGFKIFNHLYGHNAGDTLLVSIGEQLTKTVEKHGGACGRIQADMFVALLPINEMSLDDTINEINDRLIIDSIDKKITLTVGKCVIDEPQISINTIMDRAMIAHKIAKEGTTRDVYFTQDMQKKLFFEEEIVAGMEEALITRQFELYFQPIVNYESNKVITVEALVRWNHPERGILEPNLFIPIFEQNGFILNLDLYVWEEACARMRDWLDAGYNIVPISVNVSRIDIFTEDIVEKITALTKKYNIPHKLLRFEITESAYMRNSERMISVVKKLRNLGYIIEMDDFGSGFSSLNTLSEMPVDILKLDMKFISGANTTGRKELIMGHVINMAKSTDIDVIAEGVETFEQAELLKKLGCVVMQGYYFSKPVPVFEFGKMLATN